LPDEPKYGERCKTYTGMPVVGSNARSGPPATAEELAALHRAAGDHLVALPELLRQAEQEREDRRTYMNGLRAVRREIKADMRVAATEAEYWRLYEYLDDVQRLIKKGWN
jgi:hypothetical protein